VAAIIKSGNTDFSFSVIAKYLIVTNALSLLFTTTPAFSLANLIKTGKLTTYLIRPFSLFWVRKPLYYCYI